MATISDLGTHQSSTGHGAGGFTTGSFTPPANSILVAIVHAVGDGGAEDIDTNITIADSLTHTWTSRALGNIDSGWAAIARIYTAPNTPTTAFTITVDCGADNIHDYVVTVAAIESYDTGSPTGATASSNNDTTVDGSDTITLSATPASDSFVIAAISHVPTSGITGITHGTGWTELADNAVADWLGAQSQYRTGSTSTTVTWDDVYVGAGSGFRTCLCAVEIKAAAGGGETITPDKWMPQEKVLAGPRFRVVTSGMTPPSKVN
jgi:hypothetical protein